jgi:hypothetical protein
MSHRKIELLKTVSALSPGYRDAQCQAGAAGCAELGRKLEETQRTVKTLRRENEEQRKEVCIIFSHYLFLYYHFSFKILLKV